MHKSPNGFLCQSWLLRSSEKRFICKRTVEAALTRKVIFLPLCAGISEYL